MNDLGFLDKLLSDWDGSDEELESMYRIAKWLRQPIGDRHDHATEGNGENENESPRRSTDTEPKESL
jgi:hypothetical protein